MALLWQHVYGVISAGLAWAPRCVALCKLGHLLWARLPTYFVSEHLPVLSTETPACRCWTCSSLRGAGSYQVRSRRSWRSWVARQSLARRPELHTDACWPQLQKQALHLPVLAYDTSEVDSGTAVEQNSGLREEHSEVLATYSLGRTNCRSNASYISSQLPTGCSSQQVDS